MAAGNVVEIQVKAKNDTKKGLAGAAADSAKAGDDAGQSFGSRFAAQVKGMVSSSGSSSGKSFASKFASFVSPGKGGLIVSALASAMAALPALGAIGGVGMVAALGLRIAYGIPAIKKQFQDLGKSVMGTLKQSIQPMVPFISGVVKQVGGFFKSLEPELKQVFGAVGPMLAPLAHGIEGLVKGVLPGFISLMKAAAPAVGALAKLLEGLGKDLGGMFSAFAPAVKASAQVLGMIGKVLNSLLPVIGNVAGALAKSLGPVLNAFGSALAAIMPAVTTVAKVLGSLASAILGSLSGALTAVADLIKGIAPSLDVLAKALGQVFQLMENSGVFGVLEDSLEQLAKPLANLINAFVEGLVPVLPVVIRLIASLSTGAIKVLSSVLTDVLEALTPIMPLLAKLTPVILLIVGAVKAWSIAQGILNAVMDANPLGLIVIAIAALVIAVVEIVKHWHTLSSAAKTAFGAVSRFAERMWHDVAGFFKSMWKDVTQIVGDVLNWIKGHWPLIVGIFLGPVGLIVAELIQHWHAILSGVESLYHAVAGWFARLPGAILHALGDLGHLLYSAGQNLLKGLLSGIESMVGDVVHAAESVGSSILHSVEGALGIGSPSRKAHYHGQMYMQGLINGINSMKGRLTATLRQATGGMRPGGGLAGAAGLGLPGGGQLHLVVSWQPTGDPFIDVIGRGLKGYVRRVGGGGTNSAQRAFGRVG